MYILKLHFQDELGQFPHSPWPVDNFFTLHLTSNIVKPKDVEFNFRIGCILVLFLFLWIINVQFMIFEFFIFKYNDIGLLWSKITIFII